MKITYYGQSAFHIETQGQHLVFDPFISPNPLAAQVDVDAIKADYVLLSHGHQDHVVDAERIAKNNRATLVSNFEIASYYGAKGIAYHPMNLGGQWAFPFGKLRSVNAVHSSVLPDGTYAGNPGGFVVENAEGTLYFAGDTALTWDMKLLPLLYDKIDLCIFPIGDNFTMGVADAILASDFVGCDRIIGCHYDTFPYIAIDREAAKKAFADRGKDLILLDIGQTLEL